MVSERHSVVISMEEAVSMVKDGDILGIGGFVTTNKPMALLRSIMKEGKKDLALVAGTSSIEVDMMIALGLVREVTSSYVGAEALAPILPFYSRRAGRTFQVRDIDQGTFITMLRAQILRLPFLPSWGPVGTTMPALNPLIKPVADPFGGPPLMAVPPLAPDVTLIHAAQADIYGNVQHLGAVYCDPMLARAAKKVIVQVERLVSNEEIRKNPGATTLACKFVDAVVVLPYGAHPTASQNYYSIDAAHISSYVKAAREFFADSKEPLEEYLNKYIKQPESHIDYLESVGLKNILGLSLEGGL
ncbi:MAG: CoA-transferase [Bacillota bacterium]